MGRVKRRCYGWLGKKKKRRGTKGQVNEVTKHPSMIYGSLINEPSSLDKGDEESSATDDHRYESISGLA